MISFKVNGQELGNLMIINDVDLGFAPNINSKSKKYALMNGERFHRRTFGKRVIKVKFTIIGDRIEQTKIAIQKVLFAQEESLFEFAHNTDIYFKGVIAGGSDYSIINWKASEGSFEIHCYDPFAYSKKEKSAKRVSNKLVFENEGTAPVYPVYKFTAGKPYKMLSLTHPNGKAIQYGYDNGEPVINANDVVVFDSSKNELTINGIRKYINAASQVFAINVGTTEIAVLGDDNQIPVIEATYRERWL